ncbi:MAG: hypothetical protein HQ581_25265 [Planctomycetes bacterium]|nr:hypothetical protein [Planctomycetota bacterium]
MDYEHIRNQLGSFLHQDYDLDAGTVPQAVISAVQQSDLTTLVKELTQLQGESEEKIQEVMDAHDVFLWRQITPRELLVTMRTLAVLFLEEKRLEAINRERRGIE